MTASGGGREAIALAQLGYEVVAMEPEAQFYAELRGAAQDNDSLSALQISHEDLIAAPPLDLETFDGVVIGWGGLSHLLKSEDVVQLMETLQPLCPNGPILTSFFVRQIPHTLSQARHRLRQIIKTCLPTNRIIDGYLRFDYRLGLVRTYDRQWLENLASGINRQVNWFEPYPYGHAILMPASD